MEFVGKSKPKAVSIEAVIIRADGSTVPLGQVSYWHRNPLRRAAWRVSRFMKKVF